jgi:hypothetical protein
MKHELRKGYSAIGEKHRLQCKVVSEGAAAFKAVVLTLDAPCLSSSSICKMQYGKNLSIVVLGWARARHPTRRPNARTAFDLALVEA